MNRQCCAVLLVLSVCFAIAGPLCASTSKGAVAPAKISDRDWYRGLIWDVCGEYGVDPRLVEALVRVESDFNPRALSRKGAMGLMQLMPSTAQRLSVGDPFDPEQNIRGGVREVSRLVDRYSGNLPLVLAAYNAGEGAVAKYRGIPPYRETLQYVSRIMTIYSGRPYDLSTAPRKRPVRIMRDPTTGSALITNQSLAASRRGLSSASVSGASGGLSGGFGKD